MITNIIEGSYKYTHIKMIGLIYNTKIEKETFLIQHISHK